jgi:hypothetical protein
VTFIRETLNATLYSVTTTNAFQNNTIVKIPRKHAREDLNAFDLMCSVQLFSVLKRLEPNSNYEPELVEEILTVDGSSQKLLSYMAIVVYPSTTLF